MQLRRSTASLRRCWGPATLPGCAPVNGTVVEAPCRRGYLECLTTRRISGHPLAAVPIPTATRLVAARRLCSTTTTTRSSSSAHHHHRRADARLVDLPPSVADNCRVYRNAITLAQEQRLWEEIQPLFDKIGTKAFAPGGGVKREDAAVRNVSFDLHGFDEYKETRDHQRQEVRRVPGLVWSKTLMDIAQTVVRDLMGGELPDTVRAIEHHLPGYEMHVEAPPFGTQFVVLHLFAPGVMQFDNEAGGERGAALLPERGMLHCSGELRWGWRVGESFDPVMRFPKVLRDEELDPEYRISIWFFKFNAALADTRGFTDGFSDTLSKTAKHHEGAVQDLSAGGGGGLLTSEDGDGPGGFASGSANGGDTIRAEDVVVLPTSSSSYAHEPSAKASQRRREQEEAERLERIARERAEEEAFAREAIGEKAPSSSSGSKQQSQRDDDRDVGPGMLGGDLPREDVKRSSRTYRQPADSKTGEANFQGYKQDLARLGKIIERVKDNAEAGHGTDDTWMRMELAKAMSASTTRGGPGGGASSDGADAMGYNEADPAKAWDDIGARADHYRRKLQSMNFDASPTMDGAVNNAAKMTQARDAFIGETVVEPFDVKEATRILEKNREALRAKTGK